MAPRGQLPWRTGITIQWTPSTRIRYATILDCIEEYPKTSTNVDQFVTAFFENTIDNYLSTETHPVQTKKVRASMVRYLKDTQDEATRATIERLFLTFSGYVHANYAHLMEVYNGHAHDFNIAGVPSKEERERRLPHVRYAAGSVLMAGAFIARSLGLDEFDRAFMQAMELEEQS